jgi:Fe-S-cluster containining protein
MDEKRAAIHLRMLGAEQSVAVPVPADGSGCEALFPAACAVTDAVVGVAAREARVSCREGCAACCRQMVGISLAEALSLRQLISEMPGERQTVIRERFAAATRRLGEAGLLAPGWEAGALMLQMRSVSRGRDPWVELVDDYYYLRIDCPFLEGERCGIYEQRPLICREYAVRTPAENCSCPGRAPIEALDLPVRMSDAMTEISASSGMQGPRRMPLVFALAWEPEGGERYEGVELLRMLVGRLDQQADVPFGERG